MLTRVQKNLGRKMAKQLRNFGAAGPYNPFRYKHHYVPRDYPE